MKMSKGVSAAYLTFQNFVSAETQVYCFMPFDQKGRLF